MTNNVEPAAYNETEVQEMTEAFSKNVSKAIKEELDSVAYKTKNPSNVIDYRFEQFDNMPAKYIKQIDSIVSDAKNMMKNEKDYFEINRYMQNELALVQANYEEERSNSEKEIRMKRFEFEQEWEFNRNYSDPAIEQLHRDDFKMMLRLLSDSQALLYAEKAAQVGNYRTHQVVALLDRIEKISGADNTIANIRNMVARSRVGREYEHHDSWKRLKELEKKYKALPYGYIRIESTTPKEKALMISFKELPKETLKGYDVRVIRGRGRKH